MENKTKTIEGINYRYINPDDFTYEQFKIGRKLAREIMPLLQKAQDLNPEKSDENNTDKSVIQVDLSKVTDIMEMLNETENRIDEIDLIALHYVSEKYKRFNEADYKILKGKLKEISFKEIEEMRSCIPDFFTFFMPRIMDGILTSMGTMTQTQSEDVKTIENTAEQIES